MIGGDFESETKAVVFLLYFCITSGNGNDINSR